MERIPRGGEGGHGGQIKEEAWCSQICKQILNVQYQAKTCKWLYYEYNHIRYPNLGPPLLALRLKKSSKRATKYFKMGNWKLFWQPKPIIEGDKMALGLSIIYLSLCSPFLEGENFWQT